MRERILTAARNAGRPPEAVRCIYNLGIRVGEDSDTPSIVSGEPKALARRLIELRRLGFAGFNLQPAGPDRAGQIQRLADEVIPLVRQA
jgi:hypothetical protein